MRVKFFKSEFLTNVSTQMFGTGVAQLLPLLIMPLLTRMYSEKEFGLYSTFLAYSAVLIVATGGRYFVAILLPKKESEALKVFFLSNLITIFYSAFLLIISVAVYLGFKNSLNENGLIFFIPLYVCVFGLWQSFFNLSIRYKEFKLTAQSKIVQSVTYISISTILGVIFTPIGLIFGKTSGVLSSLWFIRCKLDLKKEKVRIKELKGVAKKYKDYPKYSVFPAFLDTLSLQALVFLIGYYYTELDLGYYALTSMCFAAPLALIGTSFRDVFYQRITSLINGNNIQTAKAFFVKSTLILGLIGIIIFTTLFFTGETLFTIIFGEKWAVSGKFASILSASLMVRLIVSPLSSVLNATNKVKIASLWQLIYFITTFSTLALAILVFEVDIYVLLKVYVIHEVILYSFYYILQYNSFNNLTNVRNNRNN